MELRPAGGDDVEDVVGLALRRCPDFEPSMVHTLFETATTLDLARTAWLDDRLVGFGAIAAREGSPTHQRHQYLFVDRDAEGGGVGGRLLRECLEAVGPDVREVWGRVFDDDPRALAVCGHWGFEVVQRSVSSRLELVGAAAEAPRPPADVALELVEDLDLHGAEADAFDAMFAASQTNPEAANSHVMTREEIRHWVDAHERAVLSLARVGGRPAALCYTIVDVAQGEGGVAYTGVDPAHRGRGLGRLVKQHAQHEAARLGVRRLTTDNEEDNTGIRHVNEQLGYVMAYGVYRLRLHL